MFAAPPSPCGRQRWHNDRKGLLVASTTWLPTMAILVVAAAMAMVENVVAFEHCDRAEVTASGGPGHTLHV